MKTQLLCTFAHKKDLELVADYVAKSYTISEKRLFVFSDADNRSDLYITYNVEPDDYGKTPNTIMIHRKKETNTLYTINALNELIKKLNGGVVDTKFPITWEHYKNSVLLTQHDELKQLKTKIHKIIEV